MGVKSTTVNLIKPSQKTTRITDRAYARNFLLLGVSHCYDEVRLMKSDQRHFIVVFTRLIDDI